MLGGGGGVTLQWTSIPSRGGVELPVVPSFDLNRAQASAESRSRTNTVVSSAY